MNFFAMTLLRLWEAKGISLSGYSKRILSRFGTAIDVILLQPSLEIWALF